MHRLTAYGRSPYVEEPKRPETSRSQADPREWHPRNVTPHVLEAVGASHELDLRRRATTAISADPTGRLRDFREFAGRSKWSTNVSADKVIIFNAAGELLDARQIWTARSGGDPVAGLAAFERAQGTFLGPRLEFEALWEFGEAFVYGAVNGGTAGTGQWASSFGPFCMVIDDPNVPAADALGVFPADSVAAFTRPDGTLDRVAAVDNAASWTGRADVATLALNLTVPGADVAEWPTMLCSRHAYLEAPRAGRVLIAELTEVRLSTSALRRLERLQARVLVGETLDEPDRACHDAYRVMQQWRRDHGVPIVSITGP